MTNTYSVANDLSGAVNSDKLISEITASGAVSPFNGVQVQGDVLTVMGTILNQSALDAVIHAHVATSLIDLQTAKNLAIDERTEAIIAQGFTFDSSLFSLSLEAQMNWMGLLALQTLFSWPINVTTLDNKQYSLALSNLTAFIGVGSGTVAAAIGSGRALKLAVNAATDAAGVAAVVDSR